MRTRARSEAPPLPMCFIAMPFGKKAPPGRKRPLIDFDTVYTHLEDAARKERLDCIRADFETAGGFIVKQMYERLIVAEYVVADVTFSNPNVLYEMGVRHGSSARATILVSSESHTAALPFDLRPLRVIPYKVGPNGRMGAAGGAALVKEVRKRIRAIRDGGPTDNPIMQVTSWAPQQGIGHEKTDVFLQRMKYAGALGKRIVDAVAQSDAKKAVARLAALEQEVLSADEVVVQLHTVLLGVYLGYREKKAYDRMVQMFEKLPPELRQTAVAREQLALALNRMAEQAEKERRRTDADDLRRRALATLDEIPPNGVSSETHGIRGRIYKGWFDAETKAGNATLATACLAKAIDTYEAGLYADLRDSFPGVNAATLRRRRGTPEDLARLEKLVPVVQMAVECARAPRNPEERYWQTATQLELAVIAGDWPRALEWRDKLLTIAGTQDWMRETTQNNLAILSEAFRGDGEAQKTIREIVESIRR